MVTETFCYLLYIIGAMNVDITQDKKYLYIWSERETELEWFRNAFTRYVENSYAIKKKNPNAITERCFISRDNFVSVGLWLELIKTANMLKLPLNGSADFNTYVSQFNISKEQFEEYIDELFDGATIPDKKTGEPIPLVPYHFQIEAAYKLLKYRKCIGEISTSGGKTLIAFMMFKYLMDIEKVQRVLYVVPNVNLATQSQDRFDMYERCLATKTTPFTTGTMHGKNTKKEKEMHDKCNILFAVSSSLNNQKPGMFLTFQATIIDECCPLDTKIKMADGSEKPIREIKEGDLVMTVNDETFKQEPKQVESVYVNPRPKEELLELELEDGRTIRVTANHKLLTSNRGYVRADDIDCDDDIIIDQY